jgi:hypothetical protein
LLYFTEHHFRYVKSHRRCNAQKTRKHLPHARKGRVQHLFFEVRFPYSKFFFFSIRNYFFLFWIIIYFSIACFLQIESYITYLINIDLKQSKKCRFHVTGRIPISEGAFTLGLQKGNKLNQLLSEKYYNWLAHL